MDRLTHAAYIGCEERLLVSPWSGSMRPILREERDCGVFEKLGRPLHPYDVVLYQSGGITVMHRVIRVLPDCCVIRGDSAHGSERVPKAQIYAVMTGFFRDESYFSCRDFRYRLLSRLIVWSNPLLRRYRVSDSWFWRNVRGFVRKAKTKGTIAK